MARRSIPGLSVMQPNNATEEAEARLAYAVIALDVTPKDINIATHDVKLAVESQFGFSPLSVTRFKSDFIIQCGYSHERDIVASAQLLNAEHFQAWLATWSNKYGGTTVDRKTEVSIDIDGFPPHTFDPSALGPLLEHHCSIQAYNFSESRGICRVDGYALNTSSIPTAADFGLQYPSQHGVRNIVFPLTMTAYNYPEAPPFVQDEVQPGAPNLEQPHSHVSVDSAEEAGCDRELYDDAMAWQMRANARLERARYHGHASDSDSSTPTLPMSRSTCHEIMTPPKVLSRIAVGTCAMPTEMNVLSKPSTYSFNIISSCY